MNLLTNPNFEDGHHHQDHITEIVVPNGWTLYWIDKEGFPGCGSPPAGRPESVVWHISGAPAHERDVFFLNGNYCWKVFKAKMPLYFAVTQHLTGLQPGTTYRFAAQIYPDIIETYRAGQKVFATDPWAAESRVGWSAADTPWPRAQDGAVHWAPWCNVHSGNFKCGQYNTFAVEFTAPATEARIWLECKAKWGIENNWFMDAFSLTALGEATPPDPIYVPIEPIDIPAQRVYFLLPATLPLEMIMAAVRVARDICASVGFSPHDGGSGNLTERRVIAVNPQEIDAGVDQVWYDTYYPNVTFTAVTGANSPAALEAQLRDLL